VDIGWHPILPEQRTEKYAPLYRVWCGTPGRVCVPLNLTTDLVEVWRGAHLPWSSKARRASYGRAGYGDCKVDFLVEDGSLVLDIDDETVAHWLYVVQPA
jgi:hypothetical protein